MKITPRDKSLRNLDKLIAEKIMKLPANTQPIPSYSTDLAAAIKVREILEKETRVDIRKLENPTRYRVNLVTRIGAREIDCAEEAPTKAEAICRAAAKYIGEQVD
jgi:hypothetical protein